MQTWKQNIHQAMIRNYLARQRPTKDDEACGDETDDLIKVAMRIQTCNTTGNAHPTRQDR